VELLKQIFFTVWDFSPADVRIVAAGISIEESGTSVGVKLFTAQLNRIHRAELWSKHQ
jgi:hypothetical protein